MKIETNTKIYHFIEQKDFDSYQVEFNYKLIDNNININLGTLGFQNGQLNHNLQYDPDLWSLYEDASEGIIETIYDKIASCEDERDNIEKYIDIHLDDILDEINDNTTKLKAYLNNDKDKLKQLLTLLSHKFIENAPTCEFCEQNLCEVI